MRRSWFIGPIIWVCFDWGGEFMMSMRYFVFGGLMSVVLNELFCLLNLVAMVVISFA